MIVRILGEGQFQIDPASLPTLNALDDAVEKAVAASDQEALTTALVALHDQVCANGEQVADDLLMDSDLILPYPDATLDQLKQWFEESGSDEGLIPG